MKRGINYVAATLAIALTAGLASAMDLHVFVAGDTIKAAEVNENFAELAAAIEGEKTLAFPAWALSHSSPSTIITEQNDGLLWQSDYQDAATLAIPRPADWDGTSDVVLELYFRTMTTMAGSVQFFIRPSGYDVGENLVGISSLDGPPVATSSVALAKQTFTIPALSFGTGELWYIRIQREGAAETYTDDVVLISAVLTYNASY